MLALAMMLAVLATGCASPAVGMGGGTGETANWPAPESALNDASEAMSALKTLRERQSMRTYRNEQAFLAMDGERAYQAPDRRWERVEGRSGTDNVSGETMQVANRFYKRLGDTSSWQKLDWPDSFVWPGNEFRFPGATKVGWAGSGNVDGRPARILAFEHGGTVERRNAGWEFQTRLWLEPGTNLILQRHSTGTHKQGDGSSAGMVQRMEGTWVYLDHNVSLAINEPQAAGAAP